MKYVAAFLLALVMAFSTPQPAPAASGCWTGATRCQSINNYRHNHGLRGYTQKSDLQWIAKRYAAKLAATGVLRHNPYLAYQVKNYRWAGENVGYGPSWWTVLRAFKRSPGHRALLLDRDFTQVGIGHAYGHGTHWYVVVFRDPA